MKNQTIFALVLTFLLCACGKKENCCVTKDTHILVSLVSKTGTNLLDPNGQGSYNMNDINLSYYKDGAYQLVNDPSKDLPKNCQIVKDKDGVYKLKVFVNEHTDENNISLSRLKIGDTDPDTIKVSLIKSNSSIVISKLWINGQEADRNTASLIK